MPTSPRSDVIPLRKETKRRLEAIKGERTFDELVHELIETRATLVADPPREQRARDPQEQVALAELSAVRWRQAVASGRIAELGPRLLVLNLKATPRRRLHVTWDGRRGISS